jgi:hypothetical protein
MTTADITRRWLDIVKQHVAVAQSSIEHALGKIDDAGWHPDTLEMKFLAADVKRLQSLAAQCDAKFKELTTNIKDKAS